MIDKKVAEAIYNSKGFEIICIIFGIIGIVLILNNLLMLFLLRKRGDEFNQKDRAIAMLMAGVALVFSAYVFLYCL